MQWTIVASTTIRAVRYDPASETLDIRFANGHVYRYEDVPEFVYDALMRASSKGRYFNQEIRDGYRYEQLD